MKENLLADKPEHILERGPRDVMREDNPWGFRLDMPPHLYNRGELHNLAVTRGTLTDEERYKINDHIVQTIIMLSQLPFPRHLKSEAIRIMSFMKKDPHIDPDLESYLGSRTGAPAGMAR